MLSRMAENLYWFGRYLRRAENTARLVNVNASLVLDMPRHITLGWAPLVEIIGADEVFAERYASDDEDSVVRYMMVEPNSPSSIQGALEYGREILRVSRDAVPREIWERLNDLYFYVRERGEQSLARPYRAAFLSQVINGALLIYGSLEGNMSRDVGYRFLRLGAAIEQADMTTRILDVRSVRLIVEEAGMRPFVYIQWMNVLRSLTAYQMYRRHMRRRVHGAGVLRFLLQNGDFPRSVAFCLDAIEETLPHLPEHRDVERALQRARGLVRDANIDTLLGQEGDLALRMDEIQIGLGGLHEALATAYFREPGAAA